MYKGYTSDLSGRLAKHNEDDGFKSYTTGRGPWKLVHKETFQVEKDAIKREKFLKSGQGRQFLKTTLGDYPPQADG
ncbi:MAG: GIY-YIG nuclease family protein [Candidatus Peribacteraceae bacterium]|nr:GIY-YIG nuclease family protein [Candidatus Peribacteraceae bacterium]